MQINECRKAARKRSLFSPKILLVMKLTAIMLFVACMQVSATAFSQKINLSDHKAPLARVLGQIARQSGYSLFYDKELINSSTQVDVQVSNASVEQALDAALKNQPLTWSIVDQTIVIKQKQASYMEDLKNKLKAELVQVTVTGKVVDELGYPMTGVTVKQKDKPANVTVTDAKGNYRLNVPDDKTIIVFSYVGYETQELAAKSLPSGSVIVLIATATNLKEVAINKGYYYEKKELSTGNVSVVSAKTIEEQPVADPIQALIGRVPGLDIQQTSGVPGSYATIRIRGLNSIANGNDPLYVIDGVPFSSATLSSSAMAAGAFGGTPSANNYNSNGTGMSPFNALNPDDIESIEVLKDADATAIYGSRGANGVILITTKKGRPGEAKVSMDLNQGIGQVGHFMDMLNTPQYLQMRNQAFKNSGVLPSSTDYDVNGVWDTNRYTDWQKVLIGGTAQWTNIQANVSGGTANTQFYIGGAYNHQTTVYPGDFGDTKGAVHMNLTHTSINQKFHLQFTASYVNDNNNIPNIDLTTNIKMAPDAPALYNPDGSINWAFYNGTSTFNNPIQSTLEHQTSVTNNLVSSLNLSYQIVSGLTLQANVGYNRDEMNETLIIPSSAFPPPNNNPNFRTYEYATTSNQTWIIEPQLNYTRKVAKGTLSALLGSTFQQSQKQSITTAATGFASDALIQDPLLASNIYLYGDNNTLYRYSAIFARIGYNWEDKYLLNLTARRDGSSRFGPGKQFGNFGAAGAAWVFSKEGFISNKLSWLSFGKLRASYGVTGNDQITDYQYLSSYNANSTTYQGIPQLLPARVPNPQFGWEVDKKLEGGLDLGFLKDRIDISLSYYRNRTANQLVSSPLPAAAGFSSIQNNLPAVVQNTGFEVELHTDNFKAKTFRWSTTVSFTLPKNELVSFPNFSATPYANTYLVGQSLFIKRIWQYTGLNPQTGLYTFATQNANGVLTVPQDYVATAPITQKYYGGLDNNFSYKNFSLDIFVQFVKQPGYGYQRYFGVPGTFNNNEPTAVLNAWATPGQVATVERVGTTSSVSTPYSFYSASTGVVADASFIRLKNISLSYCLPEQWQHWAHVSNARIYAQGQNLYTFTKYIGLDPEAPGTLALPPLRMITAGVSASF